MNDATFQKRRGSVVDLAKHVQQSIFDRFLPQRFVFHHVPKCGGTSVGRAFRKRYLVSQTTVSPENSFRAYEAFTQCDDRERLLVDVLDLREQMLLYHLFSDVRCVSAHVRFSEVAYARFGDRYKFVTVLREPVGRFVSHFNWSHGRRGAHAEITAEFDEFLESDRAKRMGAIYCEYFSGLPKDADLLSEVAIGRARENLARFDVVGRLNDLGTFSKAVRDNLGFRIHIGHENKDPKSGTGVGVKQLSPAQLAKVEALCAPDLAIWKAAPWAR